MTWFIYVNSLDPTDPASYIPVSESTDVPGKYRLCAIQTVPQTVNGIQRPVIDNKLLGEIIQALEKGLDSEHVMLMVVKGSSGHETI